MTTTRYSLADILKCLVKRLAVLLNKTISDGESKNK